VFCACATQWKREVVFTPGMKKPVILWQGIDYGSLLSVVEFLGITGKSREETFEWFRMIEYGALSRFYSHQV
jgi:hypothetical protein